MNDSYLSIDNILETCYSVFIVKCDRKRQNAMQSKKFKWVSRNRMVEQAVYKFASHWRNQMTSEELHQWYEENLRKNGQWFIGNVIPTDPAKLERKFWDDVEKAFRKEFSLTT